MRVITIDSVAGTGALQAQYTLSLVCFLTSQTSWQGLATVPRTVSPFPAPSVPVMPMTVIDRY
jgi:hypothetical protein